MTGRMIEAAKNYLEGETKGIMVKSMEKAGYSDSYSNHRGDDLLRNVEFLKALEARRAVIEQENKESRINIDHRFDERYNACVKRNDNTNAIRCVENMAKNRGYYELDNKQKAEQRQLSEKEAEHARRLANIILREGTSAAAG